MGYSIEFKVGNAGVEGGTKVKGGVYACLSLVWGYFLEQLGGIAFIF